VLRHGQTLSIDMLFLCQPLKFHVPVSHVFCVLLLHRCGVNSSSEMINETNTAKGKTAAQREACAFPSPLPIFMISYISSLGHALAQSLSVSAGQSKLCAFYETGSSLLVYKTPVHNRSSCLCETNFSGVTSAVPGSDPVAQLYFSDRVRILITH
jgi:hypothetical protein